MDPGARARGGVVLLGTPMLGDAFEAREMQVRSGEPGATGGGGAHATDDGA